MDTRQIEYLLKIAEENNITRAAEKLHLTQPALNQQLLRLERELGLPLFHRSRTDWRPTQAGEIYLENARKMLQIKQETYKRLGDLAARQKGTLSLAFTPGRGTTMFSYVYPRFHQKYPDIIVEPSELSVRKQQTLIARGELDLGFQTLCDEHRTDDEYLLLATEEIFLIVPKGHPVCEGFPTPRRKKGARQPVFPELDIRQLQYEPFVLMYRESTIRQLVDELFAQAGFTPNVLFETASNATILTMIRGRLCCGLIPAHYLQKPDKSLACFSLTSHPTWDIVASYRKGTYLPKAARYFIELASAYWNAEGEEMPG
ncbi:MAG: LysR family transcriptional regulator [Lachnospiraceae bacterium]|nr:LysR family transcriptional regulator [Lachnospiraceae bacterium]